MINKEELKQPLNDKFISYREIGKTKVGYVESHHVIREANSLFGFDGWSYTVKQMSMVSNTQKENKYKKMLHYVGYTAIVTISVIDNNGNAVIREDAGFGQGIDQDEGKAHEGAVKEAVTDSLKRCLRTFGDSFGLALYAKDGSFTYTETINEETIKKFENMITDRQIQDSAIESSWGIKQLSELHDKNKVNFENWLKLFPVLKPCTQTQLDIISSKLSKKGDKRETILNKILSEYGVNDIIELSFENAGKVIMRLGS